jgi:hypothetical protein
VFTLASWLSLTGEAFLVLFVAAFALFDAVFFVAAFFEDALVLACFIIAVFGAPWKLPAYHSLAIACVAVGINDFFVLIGSSLLFCCAHWPLI